MNSSPRISRITIYPIKSLDGIALEKAQIVAGGCLEYDREFAFKNEEGRFVNAKKYPQLISLRSTFDVAHRKVALKGPQDRDWQYFDYEEEEAQLCAYMSDFLGIKVDWQQDKEGGFLDIPKMSGLTVVSTASLEAVASHYPNMTLAESRKRFRASIEIEGVSAFWEDCLFDSEGKTVAFQLGEVTVLGISPRERCTVPTHHPETGKVTHAFAKSFAQYRKAHLPSTSKLGEYGHYYHLAVDCFLPASEVGKWLHVGDEVRIHTNA